MIHGIHRWSATFILFLGSVAASPVFATAQAPLAAENFPVGNAGVACEAQGVSLAGQRDSVFDRKWAILCRDVASPVGTAWVLRHPERAAAIVTASRSEALDCGQPETAGPSAAISERRCVGRKTGLSYLSYAATRDGRSYIVEGISGYESALRLALQSLMENRLVEGEVSVVSTGAGSAVALANAVRRDPDMLIGQGYHRNNAGAYAEAAELFEGVEAAQQGDEDGAERERRRHETLVNRGLQLSNIGEFSQATRIFDQARALAARDPVQVRLSRNFEAIDALNRGDLEGVGTILARPVPPVEAAPQQGDGSIAIDRVAALGLNAGGNGSLAETLSGETRLTPAERAAIIDSQAGAIGATVQRMRGDNDAALVTLDRALADAVRVRDGRVLSIIRLRAQIIGEMALAEENKGNVGAAESRLREALALVETQYPDSASMNAARARLAGFLGRHGREAEARAAFRAITANVIGARGALVGMANLMQPYFSMLAGGSGSDLDDLFLASQLIERSGAADSLAQLSRQLEGGDSKASALYRESLSVGRDIERNRILLAQAGAANDNAALIAQLQARQESLQQDQLRLVQALSAFPQFRAATRNYLSLGELRAALKPGEAYLKLIDIGSDAYALWITPESARSWRIEGGAGGMADDVTELRASISETVNGVSSTYPFDVDRARALFGKLLGPVAAELPATRHLVFEPDGAMLQLPLNLLTGDDAGIAAYHKRVADGGDEFDFRGIGWAGRDRVISTALSSAGFRDARRAPVSAAPQAFLGLGENQPLGAAGKPAATAGDDCSWPAATWNHPISGQELMDASRAIGPDGSRLLTGAAFTDTALAAGDVAGQFKILHFATHGLVTPPRDACPARPALVTSFGGATSDGLLRFDEIFNLALDADLVVLSACDTAGEASEAATREAGLVTGGGQALDGLVRAFIAAGGRQVIASHWPAPDDFDATGRLFSGFYGGRALSQGEALLQAQRGLMDDARTSHPFYWAGFAIIGDGARAMPGR